MALGLAGKSRVFGVCRPTGDRIRMGLTDFTCLLLSPPKTTKVITPGPLLEKGTIILTLWWVVTPPLQYSAPAVGLRVDWQNGTAGQDHRQRWYYLRM